MFSEYSDAKQTPTTNNASQEASFGDYPTSAYTDILSVCQSLAAEQETQNRLNRLALELKYAELVQSGRCGPRSGDEHWKQTVYGRIDKARAELDPLIASLETQRSTQLPSHAHTFAPTLTTLLDNTRGGTMITARRVQANLGLLANNTGYTVTDADLPSGRLFRRAVRPFQYGTDIATSIKRYLDTRNTDGTQGTP